MTDTTINIGSRADLRAFDQIKASLAEIDRAVQMQAAAQKKAMDGTLASMRALEQANQNRAKVEARAGAQIEADLKKVGVSQQTAINLWKQQATATNHASSAMMGMASSIAATAAGYLSIHYAIGKTVQSYKQFAQTSEQYRTIQARTGETADQMNRLKDSVLEVANKYGLAREEVLGIREAFREAGYTSAEFAKQMMGPVAQMARQYGVAGREMATTLGNFMQALRIPESTEQGVEALRMISYATRTFQLDLQQLNRYAPQLAEQMSELGVKGEEGLAKVLAMLAMTRRNFGSTTLAARAMHSAMEQIGQGGKLAHIMGMDEESWGRNMEQIEQSGGNFFDWYVEQLIEAKKRGYAWTELFTDPKVRRYWRNIIEDQNGVIRTLEEIKARGKDATEGMATDTDNAAQATQNLANSVTALSEALGYLADESGASKVMNLMAGDAVRMAKALGDIVKAIKNGDFSGLMEGIDKFTGFSNYPKTEQNKAYSTYSNLRVQGGFEAFEEKQAGGREKRALGGPVAPGEAYLVGERGPELFTTGRAGSVTGNKVLEDLDKNTERSMDILDEIRDILQREEMDRLGGGAGTGTGTGTTGTGTGGGGSVSGSWGRGGGTSTGGKLGAGATDEAGKLIDPQTMEQVNALAAKGDVKGMEKVFADKGYKMSGPACGKVASMYARSAGFTPPEGGNIATNWRKLPEMNPADINAGVDTHPFGSMMATSKLGTYGGKQGQELAMGETGGHVKTIIPGTWNPKRGTFMGIDQNGKLEETKISEYDTRFFGAEKVKEAQQAAMAAREDTAKQTASGGTESMEALVKRYEADPKTGKAWTHSYPDQGGLSIGYGTRGRPGQTMGEEEATRLMKGELARDRAKIEKMNPNLSEGSKQALTSLLYNLGGDERKLQHHGMAQAIAANDVEAMKKAHLEFSHVGGPQGKVLPGLARRRREELGLYDNQGTSVAPAQARVPIPRNRPQAADVVEAPLDMGQSDLDKQIEGYRNRLSEPVVIRARLDTGVDEQFRRRAQRDITNVATRQAAHDGWGDIGVA